MDDVDRLTESAEREHKLNLAKSIKHETKVLETGFCRWCDEPLDFNGAFCDTDCRDDFNKYKRMSI